MDTDRNLYRVLKELEILPVAKLDQLLALSQKEKKSLYELVVEKDLISDSQIGKIIADMFDVPYVQLSRVVISQTVLHLIPQIVAKNQKIVCFKKDKQGVHIAMINPGDMEMRDFLVKKIGLPLVVYYATERDIESALTSYEAGVEKALSSLIESVKNGSLKTSDSSIIQIVDLIVLYAYRNKSSDIHIEPFENHSLIRYRIDGVLHDISELPQDLHDQVITRIKVLSHLRTDEHQAPQDGKIGYKLPDEDIDIRVSIVPLVNGEKVVMRLLSEKSRQFSLVDLGLPDTDLKKVESAYKRPHGMILATGPTGSGKTTTLYSILKLLNDRDVNIMTIEDPVEYDIEGVNQIQVNQRTNLTFADGLRSIVRQDPDIILVGEIRDKETAGISVNAAMTGHLVLSTLHTNDAATTIPRLFDLGVEPYLVASTVSLIIAQRLVREICEGCRVSIDATKDEYKKNMDISIDDGSYDKIFEEFFQGKGARLYYGKGCDICHGTGHLGRIGIFEVIVMNGDLRDAVVVKEDASKIHELARKNGMRTMVEDGIQKVKLGRTTIEEILRVTKL